jgi:hypothetical protein
MIEPTPEMADLFEQARRAYWVALDHTAEGMTVREHHRVATQQALAAVFAAVERDYDVRPSRQNLPPCGAVGPDGLDCERNPHTPDSSHGALVNDGLVRW